MSVDHQFNSINEKLQHLLKQFARLQKENDRLREELQLSRNQEQQLQLRTEELQQQISILKMTSGELSDKDRKDFERKINQYIREIDKTISYLSQ
jgi:chromosome segregation ATPase